MLRIFVLAVLLAVTLLSPAASCADEAGGLFSPYVDDTGRIMLPRDYRASWAHLGSWVVPDEKAPGYGFHDVYAPQGAVEAYRGSGSFPDGAVLIKEIRKVEAADMTTGKSSRAGEVLAWFVMVKDSRGLFPQNPNWGDGWGWALFKAGDPKTNASSDYKKDCIPCHVPAKDDDWVYVEGYPTLTE